MSADVYVGLSRATKSRTRSFAQRRIELLVSSHQKEIVDNTRSDKTRWRIVAPKSAAAMWDRLRQVLMAKPP